MCLHVSSLKVRHNAELLTDWMKQEQWNKEVWTPMKLLQIFLITDPSLLNSAARRLHRAMQHFYTLPPVLLCANPSHFEDLEAIRPYQEAKQWIESRNECELNEKMRRNSNVKLLSMETTRELGLEEFNLPKSGTIDMLDYLLHTKRLDGLPTSILLGTHKKMINYLMTFHNTPNPHTYSALFDYKAPNHIPRSIMQLSVPICESTPAFGWQLIDELSDLAVNLTATWITLSTNPDLLQDPPIIYATNPPAQLALVEQLWNIQKKIIPRGALDSQEESDEKNDEIQSFAQNQKDLIALDRKKLSTFDVPLDTQVQLRGRQTQWIHFQIDQQPPALRFLVQVEFQHYERVQTKEMGKVDPNTNSYSLALHNPEIKKAAPSVPCSGGIRIFNPIGDLVGTVDTLKDLHPAEKAENPSRLILSYQPESLPVTPGTYSIALRSPFLAMASVRVTVFHLRSIELLLQQAVSVWRRSQALYPLVYRDIKELELGTRIAGRKKDLAMKLINEEEEQTVNLRKRLTELQNEYASMKEALKSSRQVLEMQKEQWKAQLLQEKEKVVGKVVSRIAESRNKRKNNYRTTKEQQILSIAPTAVVRRAQRKVNKSDVIVPKSKSESTNPNNAGIGGLIKRQRRRRGSVVMLEQQLAAEIQKQEMVCFVFS